MGNDELDKKVEQLIKVVEEKKEKIESIQRPTWQTNCSFCIDETGAGRRINIQATQNKKDLIKILSFLIFEKSNQEAACKLLEISMEEFTWMGFTINQWTEDLKSRIKQIDIKKETQELKEYESTLNSLLSPKMKRKLELDELEAKLKS